jgi:hypothetical protein
MVMSLRSKRAAGKARRRSVPHQFYGRRGKPDRQKRKTGAGLELSLTPSCNTEKTAWANFLF